MKTIKKYKEYLSLGEYEKISIFFKEFYQSKLFKDIKNKRYLAIFIYTLCLCLFLSPIFVYVWKSLLIDPSWILLIILSTALAWSLARFIIKKFFTNKWIKNEILPDFIKLINKDILYSDSDNLFNWDIKILLCKWLINEYDKLNYIEDSILYKNKWFTLQWCELNTSKWEIGDVWQSLSINNHLYISKITFNDWSVNTWSDFYIKMNTKYKDITKFNDLFKVISKSNWSLENNISDEMKKIFVNYANNSDKIYNLYFNKDIIYIIYNVAEYISDNYMEFSLYKNTNKNIEEYIDYFLEIKNNIDLSNEIYKSIH